MISISGLSSPTALKLIDATRDRQLSTMRDSPVNKRAEEAFRERIGNITSPKELIEDFEVYSFVMKAFDLEDQIFGKGLIRKLLESDPVAPESLLNRLTDSRFREMHLALGFTTETGVRTVDFSTTAFQDDIASRFYNRQYISENDAQNETVGTVLEFREQVEGIDNWFEVLRDKKMTNFFQIALGLPSKMSGLDLDQQKRILEEKYDITKLKDPGEQARLITKFTAISDILDPQGFQSNNIALSIMQSSNFGSQFVPITIDVATITFSASQLYR